MKTTKKLIGILGVVAVFVILVSIMATNRHHTTVGSDQAAIGLKQYGDQNFVPEKPISIVAPTTTQRGLGQPVPVVRVPVTAAVESEVAVHPPAQVYAAITAAQAKRLAAYLVPVNQDTWLYQIAPRGMHGKAELDGDGSASIRLTGAGATVSLSLSGGSPIMAASLAEPFFANARSKMVQYGFGKKGTQRALPHTTVQYRYHHHAAVFAFQSTTGASVYGYSYYSPTLAGAGQFYQGSVFTYSATGSAKDLAPAVMSSALANLQDIGEPSVDGPLVATKTATATVGGQTVSLATPALPSFTPQVVDTQDGIVWLSQPRWISVYPQRPHGLIPSSPFFINVTKKHLPAGGSLNTAPSQTLAVIPAYQLGDSANNPLYNNVWFDGTADQNWVLYTVSSAAPDMNDAADSVLYAVHAGNPGGKPTRITSFMDGGGGFFFVGHVGTTVVYDVANDLNPSGNISNHIAMINLSTDKRATISSKALKGDIVTVRIDGSVEHVRLKEE